MFAHRDRLTTTQSDKEISIMATDNFTLPTITIPDHWKLGRYGWLTFDISTSAGPIKVESGGYRFHCTGSAEALVEHRLIKPEWLPGLPGNNKISQRIVFGEDGPVLLVGNRGPQETDMAIQRQSRNKYCVSVPVTPEQEAFICRACEDHRRKTEPPRHDGRMAITNSQDYRDKLADLIAQMGSSAVNVMGKVEARDGSIYQIHPESREEVLDLLREVYWYIKQDMQVTRIAPPKSNDPAFESFIRRLVP